MDMTGNYTGLPSPPASGEEWNRRALAVDRSLPGLGKYLGNAPIGWFPLLERAASLIGPLMPHGHVLGTSQVKEKFGNLRWYATVNGPDGQDVPYDSGSEVLQLVEGAERQSCTRCALTGDADASMDQGTGWLLVLSPGATRIRREVPSAFPDLLYPQWAFLETGKHDPQDGCVDGPMVDSRG